MNDQETLKQSIESAVSRIPGASLTDLRPLSSPHRFGATLELRPGSTPVSLPLLIHVNPQGFPRMLRLACSELKAWIRNLAPSEKPFPIVVAPYVSPVGMEVCSDEGVGCLDLSGNCRLSLGGIFLEIQGQKNRFPTSRSLRSLFSPKSSRIARVLLSDAHRWWQVQELASKARVSIGLASVIRQRLLDQELVEGKGKSIRARAPDRLLRLWVDNYSYKRSRIREFYTLERIPKFESAIAAYCRDNGVAYGLGLFSGAARVAAHVRYGKAFVYLKGDLDQAAAALGLKPVASGPNVALLDPYDEGILFGTREIGDARVVSDLQLYLDLIGYEARGAEAAEFLFQEVLEPQWTQPPTVQPRA